MLLVFCSPWDICLFAVSTKFSSFFLFSSLFKAIISQTDGLIQILSQWHYGVGLVFLWSRGVKRFPTLPPLPQKKNSYSLQLAFKASPQCKLIKKKIPYCLTLKTFIKLTNFWTQTNPLHLPRSFLQLVVSFKSIHTIQI